MVILNMKLSLLDGVEVQLCEQPTNEVVYFNLLTDMADLPSHLKPFVPLFCSVATKYDCYFCISISVYCRYLTAV